MTQEGMNYGAVQTAEELGRLARAHRKQRCLTLETISGLGKPEHALSFGVRTE
jgi:hypothetical protein